MKIYILSSGRAHRQITWRNLPRSIQHQTQIVVPYAERHDYKTFPVVTDPAVVQDVTRTREWLIKHTEDPKLVMLDDDLVFAKRRDDDPTRFRPASEMDVVGLFAEISNALGKYAHVGVSHREGANRNTAQLLKVARMMRVLCYNPFVLRKLKIRYDRLKFMADFDVTLSLLRAGYPNLVINHIVQNQSGSNAEGGCSAYRTPEAQEKDAHRLHALHPEYTKLRKVKANWGNFDERTDVTCYWQRAFESSAR